MIINNSQSKYECCMSCGYETQDLTAWQVFEHNKERYGYTHKWLCGLCAGTIAGVWCEQQTRDNCDRNELAKVICYVGNAILEQLKK